jgi:hypothetical protein
MGIARLTSRDPPLSGLIPTVVLPVFNTLRLSFVYDPAVPDRVFTAKPISETLAVPVTVVAYDFEAEIAVRAEITRVQRRRRHCVLEAMNALKLRNPRDLAFVESGISDGVAFLQVMSDLFGVYAPQHTASLAIRRAFRAVDVAAAPILTASEFQGERTVSRGDGF